LNFRMLMDRRNRMHLVPISREEAAWKICRVQGKTVVGRGRTQVHLHDGRNLFNVDARTGDAVRLELPKQKVLDVFRLQKGSKAFIAGGSHVGEIATVERFERWDNPAPNLVYFQEGFSTVWNNVFVFGDQPLIRVPEVGLQ
jgi:small subunit ribosomal protein S4e